jgi:hypothetical protein
LPSQEWGGYLSCRVTLGLLAPGKSSHGRVILHQGALLQLVFDMLRTIWACCFEKLLEMICRQPRLALNITLNSSHKFLACVIGVLTINTFVATSGDRDSLGVIPGIYAKTKYSSYA